MFYSIELSQSIFDIHSGVGGVKVDGDALRAYVSSNMSFFLLFFGNVL